MYAYSEKSMMPSVMRTFAMSLAIAFIGTMLGVFVPPALFLPLVIIEVGMLIAIFFLRKRKAITYTFLYVFTFISGMTMYPVIAHYVATVGGNVVINALGATTVVFTGLAIYATKTKRDLSFLGGMLMAALLALIAVGIFNWIWPLSSTGMLAYSFIGILVFSGYVLFDFNRMKHYGVSEEEVPLMALNLYLDFINLFLYILRFLGVLSNRD
ncbi:Bax inhibitor-1/YccA family protein [Mesobacillus subterraneus]|uniref:Bax inhibitor-1/YccA family protein n=1 Tax=Mesobacillus subterraneus TaxID=285983 RepID=A0A3R9E5Q6_9BACI|nr:Bax inhibitor-1/YccA family protein [Mesobacillus subterraneus]RSD26730.1 Bax inhibitor-1/YccA family protein [Mesobacillus subterraneus]